MRLPRGIRFCGSFALFGPRHGRYALTLVAAGAIAMCAVGVAGAAGAAAKSTTPAGFEAQSFAATSANSAGGAVTGQKPESKLWYAQGTWWAAMVVPTSGAHDVYQLVSGNWVDTGVQIDSESTSREDVLWDGAHLYVLSRTPTSSEPNRLRRFSFVSGAYQLDSGFPVNVPGGGAEATTIAEDSTGTLWLTYASAPPNPRVMVAHSVGNPQTWTSAIALPASQASGLKGDDISAIIAFTDATGPAIGVHWDNENLQSDFFAVHRDGAPDTSWTVETDLSGTLQADDHMNLKTYNGSVYIAVKTATTTPADPLIKLLVRSPAGSWSQYPVAPYSDHNTRPIVLINTSTQDLYIFMSKGDNPAHGIYFKQTPLSNISFPSTATPFIVGPSNQTINNGTSTKQNVNSSTGIAVIASDDSNYWWNGIGLGGPPPQNTPPTANDENANVPEGTATPITLSGSDAETCQLGFTIIQPPTHGGLGGISGQPCTAGTPNTDTATVTYTPTNGYVGSDSFTYQVSDGGGLTATATASITVTGGGQTTAAPTSFKVTTGAATSGDLSSLAASDNVYLSIASTTTKPRKIDWWGAFSGVPSNVSTLSVSVETNSTASCTQTIQIRDWKTSAWVTLDSRTLGSTDTVVSGLVPAGTLSDYVDSTGAVQILVSCSNSTTAYTFNADQLALTYG